MDSEPRESFLTVSLLAAVAFLFSSCLPISAQSGAPQSNVQQQMTDQAQGQISGHVYRADTGEPIPDAAVTLQPLQPRVRGRWPVAQTGVDGSFTFVAIAPGSYWLDASALNFLGRTYSEGGQQSRPKTISLSPGQRLDNIDVRLDPAGAISGIVYDADNKPVEGIMVTAGHPHYLPGGGQSMFGDGSSTDEFGEFRISGLRPGSYYLRAGGEHENPGHRFTYREAYYPGTIYVEGAQAIEVSPGAEISGIRIRGVTTEPAYNINAKIVDPQARTPQRRYDLTFDSRFHNQSGRSSDTSFVFDGLPPGEYVLTAWAIDPASTEEGWAVSGRGYATVRIMDKDVKVDVSIGNGGEIQAKLILEGSHVVSAVGTPVWLHGGGNAAAVDQNGQFTMRDVPPGHYTFQFPTLERSAYQKRVQCSEIDYTLKSLELGVGAVTDCEITLSTDVAAIRGQVLDDGKPISGMVVVLIPESRELRQVERYTQATQSGPNGQFQIPAVTPGEYFLFAVPQSDERSYYALDFADRNRSSAQQVSIKPGETQVINLKPLAAK